MGWSSLDDLVAAVTDLSSADHAAIADGTVRPDLNREGRTGVPEVIYASGKDYEQIRAVSGAFIDRKGRAIISRIDPADAQRLLAEFETCQQRYAPRAGMLVLRRDDLEVRTGGRIGVITAGTSDIPVAEQAQIIAQEMGCVVTLVGDVGVAGIHRLFAPLQAMLQAEVDVIIVAAGMDGALPSVVSGLVDVPVIGLPTSTGYGVGGRGIAALLSMLQTCAPGLSVVNVDNGIGAGITAALIANRVARARRT